MELLTGAAQNATITKTVQTNLSKALRMIGFEKYAASTIALFNKLGILDFIETFNLECARLIFDLNSVSQCAIFDRFFETTTFRHGYQTRQSMKKQFAFPIIRTIISTKNGSLHTMAQNVE